MKKLIVLLSIVLFLVTGCTTNQLDNDNLAKNMKILLSEKSNMSNVYFDGYKYYVPKGMKFVNKEQYNASLLDRYGNKYYLYVDAISFYHKVDKKYKVENSSHYSKKLNYNGKTGYIQIDKSKGKFLVQFIYNYAKMEAYVSERDLTNVVNNMCYILRSLKYNRTVLESLIGNNVLSYKEENYSLFKQDSSKENFLDVVEKNESDAYKEAVSEDEIDLSNE